MPSGVILASASIGSKPEDTQRVLAEHGYEAETPVVETPEPEAAEPETPEKPEVPEPADELVEPKREDFSTDEEFEEAQEVHAEKLEEKAEAVRQQKRPSRHQRAIQRATRELQEQLKQANERLAALEGKKAEPEPEQAKAPRRSDFPDGDEGDRKFDDAMFDFRYQQRRARESAEEVQNAMKAEREEHWNNYKTNAEEIRDTVDDWDEVINSNLPISEALYEAIVALEDPAITYYLGKHPEELDRLNHTHPVAAVAEVGRIAERLKKSAPRPEPAAATKPKPKPIAAPPPLPKPVKPLAPSAVSTTLTSKEAAQKGDFRAFKVAQRNGR